MAGEQTNNRMPGFTAQDSLYKTGGRYQTAAKWSGSTQGQAVIPQQRRRLRQRVPGAEEGGLCEYCVVTHTGPKCYNCIMF
jgi:hypothetical protein